MTSVQFGGEAASVRVDGDVRRRRVEDGISNDHRVNDALAGDGAKHHGAHFRRGQRHNLRATARRLPTTEITFDDFGVGFTYAFAALPHAVHVRHGLDGPEEAALRQVVLGQEVLVDVVLQAPARVGPRGRVAGWRSAAPGGRVKFVKTSFSRFLFV